MAEGSWKMTKGIFDRLKRDGVERSIKDTYWSKQINDVEKFKAIWKYRARPNCQFPYAVYNVVTDFLQTQSSGKTAGTIIQYRAATVQFRCYAQISTISDETWAIAVAGLIVNALENGKLSFPDDTRFITLTRLADEEGTDDEGSVAITVNYEVEYELTVNATRLHA